MFKIQVIYRAHEARACGSRLDGLPRYAHLLHTRFLETREDDACTFILISFDEYFLQDLQCECREMRCVGRAFGESERHVSCEATLSIHESTRADEYGDILRRELVSP